MTAIAVPLLLGFGAFGVDVSSWYLKQRSMQGGADAAAISAAAAYLAGGNLVTEGKNYASKNGWTDGSNQVTVTITPFLTASPPHIDADIAQPQQAIFSRFLPGIHTEPTVRAHSSVTIRTPTTTSSNGCLIGLSFTSAAIQISGQGFINAPTCVVVSNTNTATQAASCLTVNPPCLTFPSNANSGINVAELDVATQAPFVCPSNTNATCQITTKTTTYPLWTPDPYATRVMPTPPGCPGSDPVPAVSATGVTTYSAGTYCHGISVSGGNSNVVFNTGIYFLGGSNNGAASSLSITGGAVNQTTVASATISAAGTGYKKNDTLTVVGGSFVFPTTIKVSTVNGSGGITAFTTTSGAYTGSTPASPVSVTGGAGTGAKFNVTFQAPPTGGVTFLLTGPSAATVGTVSIANATVTLTALSGGATDGLIFWQDKKATGASGFAGNPSASTKFTGAMYFPGTTVSVSGNSTFLPTNCTAIVANIISFTGNGSISKGCLSVGGGSGGGASVFRLSQ